MLNLNALNIQILSTYLNGTQVDIQPVFVFDSKIGKQLSYEHIYFFQNNLIGDEQADEFSNKSLSNPCKPNPCKNAGVCTIGIGFSSNCFCSPDLTGYCD